MRAMRVAMVATPWLSIPPDGYGGIENVVAALVPALLDLGVKVELFTIGDSTLRSTKKHWLYKEGQYAQLFYPIYDSIATYAAQVLFALNEIEQDGHFDIIHDHNVVLGPLAMYFATKDRLPPMVHTLHGPPFSTSDRLKMGIPDNRPMWRQFEKSNRLYFVSISQFLAKRAPRPMKPLIAGTIYNGINPEDFPFEDQKSDYFMTLARIHPDKGQALAVKACLDLGYKLKMAGGMANIASARKLILELANPLSNYRHLRDFRYFSDRIFPYLSDDQIENLGELQGKRKLDTLKKARALLFPIQWDEPFGMAAIEALACGTPVVAMARGALPEIIKHGVNGFLARSYSEFKYYMTKVDDIDPMDCLESVEEKFSAHVMAEKYLQLYRQISGR